MKIKFLGLMLCLCFAFLATDIMAQSSKSSSKSSCTQTCTKGSYNISVSINENDNNGNYKLSYSSKYTEAVDEFLTQKLGRRYSKTLGLKRWEKDYVVVSSKGNVSITYQGTDENKRDAAKALFNEVIDEIKASKS